MIDIGPQYEKDDEFKARARLHQSRYRAEVLRVGYFDYGNRLVEPDAKKLLNYYDELDVRQQLRKRYPRFSQKRDGDMLRSEHIPFNLFGPLASDLNLAQRMVKSAFGIECDRILRIEFEYAPKPKQSYLDDATAFDTYIEVNDSSGLRTGIGVEVKYSEQSYPIGNKESERVRDQRSSYWCITRQSGCFVEDRLEELANDDLRQIWRNHLLGLAMVQNMDIANFYSITMFPSCNRHFTRAITTYRRHLVPAASKTVKACTYEQFISAINGDVEVEKWREFLRRRYIVDG